MELWDLYNEKRELTGRRHIRGQEIPQGFFHLVVHIWIENSKGEFLISQRAADRPTFALMYECVGGSILLGENSLQGALREVKEEVGIDLTAENGKLLFSKIRRNFNDILDVYLFRYDGDIPLEKADTKEVAQAFWMNRDEIKTLYEQKKLVSTLDYFFTDVIEL